MKDEITPDTLWKACVAEAKRIFHTYEVPPALHSYAASALNAFWYKGRRYVHGDATHTERAKRVAATLETAYHETDGGGEVHHADTLKNRKLLEDAFAAVEEAERNRLLEQLDQIVKERIEAKKGIITLVVELVERERARDAKPAAFPIFDDAGNQYYGADFYLLFDRVDVLHKEAVRRRVVPRDIGNTWHNTVAMMARIPGQNMYRLEAGSVPTRSELLGFMKLLQDYANRLSNAIRAHMGP